MSLYAYSPATALVYAASDGKHRPASHPLLGGRRRSIEVAESRDWSDVFHLVANRRKALGWTQQRLADAVGVTRPAVSWWEGGEARPSDEHLRRLERLLGRLS